MSYQIGGKGEPRVLKKSCLGEYSLWKLRWSYLLLHYNFSQIFLLLYIFRSKNISKLYSNKRSYL